jgi:two-component system OmpR family response regulator
MNIADGNVMNFGHDDSSTSALAIESTDGVGLPPQVIVVDDSRDVREIVGSLLRNDGYRVLEAENGQVAQSLLATEHPALVISDLEMPNCDGWELLTFCHSHHPGIPVLIMSGSTSGKWPNIERWASGFLRKPFVTAQLESEVHRLISRTTLWLNHANP